MTVRRTCMLLAPLAIAVTVAAQTPQPFPRGNQSSVKPAQPAAPQPPSLPSPAPGTTQAPVTQAPSPGVVDPSAPTAAQLGFPLHPAAQFLTSYDAGRGQRYYLFGASTSFAEIVQYYRTVLKERGTLVFEQPPTHMFEVGRFREETMAFPPGVTVKDYATGVSGGYPNPKPNAQPARFATIIQIVPAPPATPPPARR